MLLDGSQIRANAFGGNGGNITIEASDALLITSDSILDASSQIGLQGRIDIRAPVAVTSDHIELLPRTFVQAVTLLQARCEKRGQGSRSSSFIVAGREGVPVEPGGMWPSPPLLVDLEDSGTYEP